MRPFTLSLIIFGLYQLAFAPLMWAASPDDDFTAVWTRVVAKQSAAADAELTIQKNRLTLVEQQYRQGLISPDELQQTREQTLQAHEWAQVLRRQQDFLKALPDKTAASNTQDIRLRIPGLPAAFFDDEFCYVDIAANPRTLQLASQIADLTAELEGLSNVSIQQSLLSNRLRDLEQDAQPHPEHAQEFARLRLQQQAAGLDLAHLEELLVTPVLLSDSRRTTITRNWILNSRKTLLTQALRQYPQSGGQATEYQTPDTKADQKSSDGLSGHIATLQREIYVASNPDVQNQKGQLVQSRLAARLAILMRLARESHDRSQQELTDATENSRQMNAQIAALREKAEADPSFTGQLLAIQSQADLAAAHEQCLTVEEQRRRTMVRFAMALYRFESGRDIESHILREQRTAVFDQAADRRAELHLTTLQLRDVQARLDALQQLEAKGLISRQTLSNIIAESQALMREQQCTELRMKIAQLCRELLKHIEKTQTLALDRNQNAISTDLLTPKSPDA